MPVFNEDNTTEQMLIHTLRENGWQYIPVEELDRRDDDVMVESMVRAALIRLNPEIARDESRADEILYVLRTLISSTNTHNLVTQNEAFKELVFEKNSFPCGEDGKQTSIDFFGTETNGKLEQNQYVVTNQWVYPRKSGGKRLDIVLLVNGFPLVIGELKTPVRPAVTWLDGAQDLNKYEQSIPQMFAANVFNFATEGKCYRYGSVCMPAAKYGPWHTAADKSEGSLAAVQTSVRDMMTPHRVMDLFEFFTLYATDSKYRKYKVIARYQQYEGANMIVDRVRAGYPKKGLIWHFQGSGKSYLMEFAAVKLRMLPQLKNPTVIIVDDRLDLESQITAQFHSSDVGNLVSASTREQLMTLLRQDIRKIIITTIYRFQEVTGQLSLRDNIIVLVDECHRTQEGNLGVKMRTALPNAFFFGLTGTPINRTDKNTFATFGAEEDRSGYMSKYAFSDSIRDHATLPLNFEPVPAELRIDRETMDREFEVLTRGLSDAERAKLSKGVDMKAIMRNDARIHKVCAHIARHFTQKIRPNGYKAQVVVHDRCCCVKYKRELDKLLGEACSTVVMDINDDKTDKYKAYRRSKDEEARVLDRFRDPNDPLEILIVTAKLLTGFDAPVLQVMYLDKLMKDHTLLQAICRTNRTYDGGKTNGLVVDYIGIFRNVAKALDFDEGSMRKVITNIEDVKKQIPALLQKCLGCFVGIDRTVGGWEGLMAAQECLPASADRDRFAADYQVLNRAWNAVSPDPVLVPLQPDYVWLSKVYESVKPVNGSGGLVWSALGAKTMEIVNRNMDVEQIHDCEEILTLDPAVIGAFIEKHKSAEKAARKVEFDLASKIRRHSGDPKFIRLGDRLETLRQQHEQGIVSSTGFLKMLLEMSMETVQEEKQADPKAEIGKGMAALRELFSGVKASGAPVIAADIDDIVSAVRFDGWQNTAGGRQEVKKALRSVVWVKHKIKDKEIFEKAYSYVEQYY